MTKKKKQKAEDEGEPRIFLVIGTMPGKPGSRNIILWPMKSKIESVSFDDVTAAMSPFRGLSTTGKATREYEMKRGKCGDIRPTPGHLWRIRSTDKTIWTGGPSVSYLGIYHDSKVVTSLAAVDRGRVKAADAAEAMGKALKANRLQDALDPIRDAYSACRGPQRAQLLAQIVEYVTRGK